MKKKWVILFVALIVGAYFLYRYINKDHRDISSEKAEFEISAVQIASEFQSEPLKAQNNYLNKTIIVSGKVSEFELNTLTLDNTIFCDLKSGANTNEIVIGETISIKGRCIGYDDLLGEIKLDQCSILN
ncbi:OB-fold protein [Winogradskyella sp. A3E31]|uniref:OB-fold protein n=1 Tax=Winogradskyella sp. A3E31 TaxID=3349637 RepID=UPI00398B5604